MSYEHVHAHARTFLQVASLAMAWALLMTASPAAPHERATPTMGARRATLARVKVRRLASPDAPRAVSAAARARAELLCPVERPRRWLPGDWRPRPYRRGVDGAGAPLRAHLGIDLFAPRGTKIRAPFDGRLQRGHDRRGGRWFRLWGAKGYVFGSHMHAFSARAGRVKAGQVIGYVGNTGNARYTSPHLHFEWHPKRKRYRASDPEGFLIPRCGGPTRRYLR